MEHEALKRTNPVLGNVTWKLESSPISPKRLEDQIEAVAKCKIEPLKPGGQRAQHRLVDQHGFPYYFNLPWLWPEMDEAVAKSKLTEPFSCIAFWSASPLSATNQTHGIRVYYTTSAIPPRPQLLTIEPFLNKGTPNSGVHGWSQNPFTIFPEVLKHLNLKSFIPYTGVRLQLLHSPEQF